ncbi:MAG: hypothetical protein HETSPECPRED_000005 [Heterodermia speciosa]|uniref:FAD-binding domain-containing protein n=1 Tax=Heterodermia speciosa TaxID=116794 RepID=A0A8H3I0R9_9LECA|nr:MAG: hypothetical protein HETSPECPRED_000005 [Heterodermia speciosa]
MQKRQGSQSDQSTRQFHALIVGAGSVGCLIAQRCKTLNIRCTLFERENYLNERRRDWNFGITHALPQFQECLPDNISSRLTSVLVDPIRGLSGNDTLPMLNAESGELLMTVPTPNVFRLQRSKFRALIAEGIDIQYGKRLSNIRCEDESTQVSAQFEDGTEVTGDLLIGADGANSKVREFLFGPDEAALQPMALIGCGAVERLPAKISRQIRDVNDLYFVSYHPAGVCAFMALHDVPDASKPETWKWMFSLTWPDRSGSVPRDPKQMQQKWTEWAEKLAEPFRSAYLAIAPNATFWCDRLAEWRTKPWDNRNGRVTLAGDAAHPMTYHRGQGLNNGILDAAFLCRALSEHERGEKDIAEVLAMYEEEMQERGRAAVISSGENSLMVHDWKQLKKSPVFTMGLKALEKSEK